MNMPFKCEFFLSYKVKPNRSSRDQFFFCEGLVAPPPLIATEVGTPDGPARAAGTIGGGWWFTNLFQVKVLVDPGARGSIRGGGGVS